MGQWTNAGFEAKTLDYYKSAIQQVFVDAFGSDFLLDDALPQGVLIQELAELFYNADMDGIEAFSRLNINTASGIYLDLIGSMRGLSRSLGTPQIATVALTINPENFMPFSIPEGYVFTATNGDTFTTDQINTISSATDQSIFLYYTSAGNSDVAVGDKMSTTGFNQITDIEVTYLANGTDEETDMEYRSRIIKEKPVPTNTIQHVMNKLLELQTVRTVGVNYNDTDQTVDNIPKYATEWMAVPEDDADIALFKSQVAKVIIDNKVPGSPTYGNTTQSATDTFGITKTINFTIPTRVNLRVNCTVTTPESTGILDLTNATAIKQTIVNYINTLNIGDNVSFSRVAAPLTADGGFDLSSIVMSNLPTATASQTTGTSLSNVSVDAVSFETFVIVGTTNYVFEYDGTDWKYGGDPVNMSDIGINYMGTPVSGDAITVVFTPSSTSITNGNFPIGNREYAHVEIADIIIGV